MSRTRRALLVLGMGALLALPPPVTASFEEVLERAALLMEEERYREARELLDPLVERAPDHPQILLLDGILHAREGNADEAIEIFDRLRRDRPELSEPWEHLAVLYAAQGRFDEARESLLVSLERKPSAVADLGAVRVSLARRASARSRATEGDASAASGSDEAKAPPSPAASGEPIRKEPPACLRTGGFEDREVFAEVRRWLASQGAGVFEVRREEIRQVSQHRVYLPPFEDREEAAAKVRELEARGVHDVAIIASGPLANGISFGVFGVAENMRRRVAALQRLGYPVLSRDDVKTVHRLLVETRAEGDPEGPLAAWVERFPEYPLEPAACE